MRSYPWLAALLSASALAQPCSTAPLPFVPFNSFNYRFLAVPSIEAVPPGWELPSFDDSLWSFGCAPFGGGNRCTVWPGATVLLLRKRFDFGAFCASPQLQALEASMVIIQTATIWLNGTRVSPVIQRTSNCFIPTNVSLLPASLNPFDNLLAVQAVDIGQGNCFDVELRLRCCPCQTVGYGHAGGGIQPTCVTMPRPGSLSCVSFSDPNPAGYNLLVLGPGPALDPPIPIVAPGTVCAPASFHLGSAPLVLERTGNPVSFCLLIPAEPALIGQSVLAQGAALELSGCFRFTDALRMVIQP
jgi:hypothetical protein